MSRLKGLVLCIGVAAAAAAVAAQDRGRLGGPGYLKLFDSNQPYNPKDIAGSKP
jgi:hypothetical protein